jgi:hypothetical protein
LVQAVTVAKNGTPYIVEKNGSDTDAQVINLTTGLAEISVVRVNVGTSTEYANYALEVAEGVVAFLWKTVHIWVDVNTMASSSASILNADVGYPLFHNETNTGYSIANFPLHLEPTFAPLARNTKYSVYANGVAVTGV